MYAGGWIYGLSNNALDRFVLALEYADPQFDPHAAFQIWKTHPFLKNILEGGKLVRYGAKSLPYGDGTRCADLRGMAGLIIAIQEAFSIRSG